MRGWLYDPKNEYKGAVFEDEEYEAKVKEGWEDAPYPSEKKKAKVEPKIEDIVPAYTETPAPPPTMDFNQSYTKQSYAKPVKAWDNEVKPKKPGRKPHAAKKG